MVMAVVISMWVLFYALYVLATTKMAIIRDNLSFIYSYDF